MDTHNPLLSNLEGRYDSQSELLFKLLDAKAVLLMVIGGVKGTGFSVSVQDPELIKKLPQILRDMADMMEANKR